MAKRRKQRKARASGAVRAQVALTFPPRSKHPQALFIQEVAVKSKLSPTSVKKMIEALTPVVAGQLKEKGKCRIANICQMTVKTLPARERKAVKLWGKQLYLKTRPAGRKKIAVRALPPLRGSAP